jgi:hypothetical protein
MDCFRIALFSHWSAGGAKLDDLSASDKPTTFLDLGGSRGWVAATDKEAYNPIQGQAPQKMFTTAR